MRKSLPLLTSCVLAAALVFASCENEFEPLAPTELQFSVYGYFDASADTQWIRVMPIRPLILTTPDSFDAVVTLEHLGNGTVIQLRDSLFRFTSHTHPEVGSEGMYVHNYWTTEPIEPGASYRFTVQRDGEEPSEAIVKIPLDYDIEVSISQFQNVDDGIRLEGVKNIAFVAGTASFYDACGSDVFETVYRRHRREGTAINVTASRPEIPPRNPCGAPNVEKMEIWTAVSEAEWPSVEGGINSPWAFQIPSDVSNVSNSLGFVGGVLTRRIPYEQCKFRGPFPIPAYCVLRYDDASATLLGTIREIRCGDGALEDATVVLSELDGEPIAHRRIRETLSTRSGAFEISALVPGMRYAMDVYARPVRDSDGVPSNIHSVHRDTLQFTAGERRQYDVGLIRYTLCSQVPG